MHPILPLIIAHLAMILAWPFLSSNSVYRHVVVGFVLACCATSFQSIDKTTWWGVELAEYVFGFAIYTNYFLNLVKLTLPPERELRARLDMAVWFVFNPRIDIDDHLIPPFRTSDPQYVPSKREFLLKRSWTFIWTISVFFLLQTYTLTMWPDDFDSPKHQLLRRVLDVSAREWIIVLYLSFCSWFQPYYLFTAVHSLTSVIYVGAAGGGPYEWRPLFGDLGEAYTVQRFHGFGEPLHLYNKILTDVTGYSGINSCGGHSQHMQLTSCAISLVCLVYPR